MRLLYGGLGACLLIVLLIATVGRDFIDPVGQDLNPDAWPFDSRDQSRCTPTNPKPGKYNPLNLSTNCSAQLVASIRDAHTNRTCNGSFLELNNWGRGAGVFRVPACTLKDCFDASRPGCTGIKLTVFRYCTNSWFGGSFTSDAVLLKHPGLQLVEQPEDACLFVASARCVNMSIVPHLLHWNITGTPGRNHLILAPNCVENCDSPVPVFPPGEAMLADHGATIELYRPGFDLKIFCCGTDQWPHTALEHLDDEPRSNMLVFRGSVYGYKPGYRHRVTATYLNDPSNGVIVELSRCGGYQVNISYPDLLISSKYCFAPDGNGPYSNRLYEVVRGCVPVVMDTSVLPLSDVELSNKTIMILWEQCVVRVSEGQLWDLPARLRAIPESSCKLRRKACLEIVKAVYQNAGFVFWSEYAARIAALQPKQNRAERAGLNMGNFRFRFDQSDLIT